ncbi:MAG TPA: peptidylprolyl isomerase [Gemmatimonadaceae bacterium]|nr:peptidylprolyl isomerase [Gemmatimonadaceae bacterium]
MGCGTLIGGTHSNDAEIALRARLMRIEDTRRDEPAFVDSLLDGADSRRRSAAALSVGRVGARAYVPRLRVLAADGDTGVAAAALFALGLLKDTAAASVASEALRAHPTVAGEGAWLLGQLGEHGRPALVRALRDPAMNGATRGALLLAAARLRPVPADVVIPWVTSGDTAVAWRAAYALARGRSAAGVSILLAVTSSRSGSLREQVARGLTRAVSGDSLGDRARAALALLVSDAEPRVRVNAVRALASHGRVAGVQVVASLRDPDASVRLASAQSLDLVLDSSAMSWAQAFDGDTAFVMQRTIAGAAARRGVVLDAVRAWRGSDEWQRRAAAAELDANGEPVGALERLVTWRADADGRVRATGAGALAVLADSPSVSSRARLALHAALDDVDTGVRTAALDGLARGASEEDLSAALEAYARSAGDGDNDARLAFWCLADSALARSAGRIGPGMARRLDALSRPADPLERIVASRIPRFSAWRDSTGVARPLPWYVARARESLDRVHPVARIEIDRGVLEIVLDASNAPLTVHNFVMLAGRGYFDGQRFHRVVPNFVVQAGDPRGDGSGGPGYAIRDEMNRRRYLRGTVGMALSGPDTGGSQFFITHSPQPHLDGGYTVFGQVRSGADVLDRIVQGDRIVHVSIR